MSLHSKELFHSNFLWWLGKKGSNFRELFKKIMNALGVPEWETKKWGDNFEVEREWKIGSNSSMDLVVKDSDRRDKYKNGKEKKRVSKGKLFAVIENKVKSIPTKEQLEKYSKVLPQPDSEKNKVYKILLTIAPLDFGRPIHPDWHQSSYKKIVDVLNNWKNERVRTMEEYPLSYDEYIVADYTDMLGALIEVVSVSAMTDDMVFPFSKKKSEGVEELRISDLVDKWSAAYLSAYVTRMLEEKKLDEKVLNKKCYSGYTKGQPLIEIKLPGLSGNATGCIQIQGNKYCLCIEGVFPQNKKSDLAKYLSTTYPDIIFKTRSDFRTRKLEDCPDGRKIFDSQAVNKEEEKEILIYGQDSRKSRFIYQYVEILPDATIGDIISQIEKDIEKFKNLLPSERVNKDC